MKTKRGMWLVVIVIAAMVCSTAVSYAGGAKPDAQDETKHAARFEKMTKDLGLAPDQKAALEKDRNEFMAKAKDLREKIREVRTSLKSELDKAATDMAKVNGLVADLKNLIGQQIQYRIDKVMAMKKILTPEQFTKMKSTMESRKKEFKGKHGNSGRYDGKDDDHAPDMI